MRGSSLSSPTGLATTAATPSILPKSKDELGWRAKETLDTGLAKTVAWYLANRNWWEPLRTKRLWRRATWVAGALGRQP